MKEAWKILKIGSSFIWTASALLGLHPYYDQADFMLSSNFIVKISNYLKNRHSSPSKADKNKLFEISK